MKKLSEVLKDTRITAEQQDRKTLTVSDGLETGDTRSLTQYQPKGMANLTKDRAIQVRCLLRRSEPGSNYEYVRKNGILERMEMPDLTEEEIRIADCYRLPAKSDRILSHLGRLAMHKRMDGNDPDRNTYLLADYADRLDGVTEVEIIAMVEHWIENETGAFFPQYAEMKEWLQTNFRDAHWSKYYKEPNNGAELTRRAMEG